MLERLPGAEVGGEREGADHLGGTDRPLGRRHHRCDRTPLLRHCVTLTGPVAWFPAVDYLMKRISEYFGNGQRSSATIFSSSSPTSRTRASAASWLSRAYSASSMPSTPSG